MQRHAIGLRGSLLGLGLSPLLLLHEPLRHAIESRMLLHMLVEFPLLTVSGWALIKVWRPAANSFDEQGLLCITALLCVSAFWMIPLALDMSLLSAPVQCAKLASWWLCGALLARSGSHLSPEACVFLFGNLAWMWATAGLLYQDEEQRLCVNYLIDDQLWTGRALVGLAVLSGVTAVWAAVWPAVSIGNSPQARSATPTTPTTPTTPARNLPKLPVL